MQFRAVKGTPVYHGVQNDFSGGCFPGHEDIPLNGCEDIINGFLRDDGAIERRGGSTYKSTSDSSAALTFLWDGYLVPGQRTVFAAAGAISGPLYTLNTNDASPLSVATMPSAGVVSQRPAGVRGVLFGIYAPATPRLWAYGGSRKTASYTTGTVTVTAGSKTVTGAGTSWAANADAGMILGTASPDGFAAVESVDSDTQVTLRDPWAFATGAGAAYQLTPVYSPLFSDQVSVVAAINDRLVMGHQNRVRFTAAGNPFSLDSTDYHDLPEGVQVIGMEPVGDTLLVFTSGGVFAIDNMAFDLTDDAGNPQQTVRPISDAVLWANNGAARYQGAVIAPCTHDVIATTSGGDERGLGGGVRRLYRTYVDAGYTTGFAAVYRGHYLLPILNGTTWVDTLVLRLDSGGWARWNGHGGQASHFTVRAPTSSTSPKLFGVNALRVIDDSAAFAPSATVKNDADGTTHQLKVTTRGLSLSEAIGAMWERCRARLEIDDAASDNPTVGGEYSSGRPGGSFTAMTGLDSQQEGDVVYRFLVSKRAQQIRVRLTQSNAASRCVLRAVEVFARPSGRS